MSIESFAIFAVLCIASYGAIRWIMSAPVTPDPWGAEVERSIQDPQTPTLCHRCLTPQQHEGWFCPACGAAVGPYNNYMPYVYLFSTGEVLRAGVMDQLRPSFLIFFGYGLFSLISYGFFAPIHWYFIYRNFKARTRDGTADAVQDI